MIHFLLTILLLNSFVASSYAMDKQPTGSGSGSAGSAAALPLATFTPLLATSEEIPVKLDWDNLPTEPKARVQAINKQLQSGDRSYKHKQAVIEKAIKEGVHPDRLLCGSQKIPEDYGDYSENDELRKQHFNKQHVDSYEMNPSEFGPTWITPLCAAIGRNDIAYARFLLQNGANPNQGIFGRHKENNPPVFQTARSAAMADLLLEYGATPFAESNGFKCLKIGVLSCQGRYDMMPSLAQWYVDHDVPVDRERETILGLILLRKRFVATHPCQTTNIIQTIYISMEAGAALNLRLEKAGSIPRWIRNKIDTQRSNDIDTVFLRHQRDALIEASNNRQLKVAALVSTLLGTNLIPPLITIIKHYYVPNEPTYEQLEAMDDTAASSAAQTAAAQSVTNA